MGREMVVCHQDESFPEVVLKAGGCGGKRKMEVTLSKSPSIYHKTETKRFKILLVFLQFVLLLLVYIYSASSMAEFLLKAHL